MRQCLFIVALGLLCSTATSPLARAQPTSLEGDASAPEEDAEGVDGIDPVDASGAEGASADPDEDGAASVADEDVADGEGRLSDPGEEADFMAVATVPLAPHATSSLSLSGGSLRRRPYLSAGDLLNAAPGFFVAQHGGGGKAQQYFLRGFDADHGTDVRFLADGVPLNLRSHGHGQGFTELHWIIPELVERLEIQKGPYFAEHGDFATAGTVHYRLADALPTSSFTASAGRFGTFRLLGILSPELERGRAIVAAETLTGDGPFDRPNRLRRFNTFGRVTLDLEGGGALRLTLTSYLSRWRASGQIPAREVSGGRLSRFGSVDPNEGGQAQRHSVVVALDHPASADAELRVQGYLVAYRLALYSNFSFFAGDPLRGDMIRQTDQRVYGGVQASYRARLQLGDARLRGSIGTQTRVDTIRTGLAAAPMRIPVDEGLRARTLETSAGLYAEGDLSWRRLRVVLGGRADYVLVDVSGEEETGVLEGDRDGLLLSPKANVVLEAHDSLRVFLNFGGGFHSNDARGAVSRTARVPLLTRAYSYELGVAFSPLDELEISATSYVFRLESELVYVADEGTTEPRGRTRRVGVELTTRARPLSWLALDLDWSWNRSVFLDNPGNASSVALAPTYLLSGGVEIDPPGTGLSARLGVVYVADRPATEDGFLQAQGFFRVDMSASYTVGPFVLGLMVQNLTNTRWREAQFASETRLRDEDSAAACTGGSRAVSNDDGSFAGCEDITFTPGSPLQILGSVAVNF